MAKSFSMCWNCTQSKQEDFKLYSKTFKPKCAFRKCKIPLDVHHDSWVKACRIKKEVEQNKESDENFLYLKETLNFSPVPSIALKIIFLRAINGNNQYGRQGDAVKTKNTYWILFGHPQAEDKTLAHKSNAAIHGLPEDSKLWYFHYFTFLKKQGCTESKHVPDPDYLFWKEMKRMVFGASLHKWFFMR